MLSIRAPVALSSLSSSSTKTATHAIRQRRQIQFHLLRNVNDNVSIIQRASSSLVPNNNTTTTTATACYQHQHRHYHTTKHMPMMANIKTKTKTMVYEEEEISNNNNKSNKEQERIKLELSTQTGTNDSHLHLLHQLDLHTNVMNSLLHDHDTSINSDGSSHGSSDNDREKEKDLIQKMQTVAQLHWELGMLDDAQSLQEQILKRQIELYTTTDDETSTSTSSSSSLPNHIKIAQTLHTIGSIQSRLNQPIDAKRWFKASIQMKEHLIIHELKYVYHHEIGKTLNGLALVNLQLNHYGDGTTSGGDDNDGDSSVQSILSLFQLAENHYVFHGEHSNDNDDNTNDDDDDDNEYDNHNHNNNHIHNDESYKGNYMADHPHVGSINANMAMLYRQHGDFTMALSKYKEALRIEMLWTPTTGTSTSTSATTNSSDDENENDNSNLISLIMDIGDCYKALTKYEQALEQFEQALDLHMVVIRKERFRKRQQLNTSDDGSSSSSSSNSSSSSSTSSTSAVLDPTEDTILNSSPIEGILRHNIGMMHSQIGNHKEAMEEYQSSLKIKKQFDLYHPEVALTLNGIGALQASLGEYDSSLAYFREALYIYRINSTTAAAGSGDGSSKFDLGLGLGLGLGSSSGLGEDEDENIAQTKKNIELVERQQIMGGSSSRGRGRGGSGSGSGSGSGVFR